MKSINLLTVLLLLLTCYTSSAQEDISFEPAGGNYPRLTQVKFNIPENVVAYYTTAGKYPSKSSRKLTSKINLVKNTVFRIAYYSKEGKRRDTTVSYIVENTHQIPVISIVTDPDNFFDYSRGIYVKGCCADTINPYQGANFWKNWERKINIEFFETDGSLGFNQSAGVKIFGGFSKSLPQKSLALYARSKYGESRFQHKIFPQLKIKEYKSFILRNAGSDMQEAHVRDVFATQLVKSTGLNIQEYRPSAVYINGEYWGIYNIREKITEYYVNSHTGLDKDSVIIMRHRNGSQEGSTRPYRRLISYIERNTLTDTAKLNYVSKKMDIDNYILYNISETYTANHDAGGNIRYFKGVNLASKWRWVFYDLDMGLNISNRSEHKENTIETFTKKSAELWPSPAWSTLIIRKIIENDSLKHLYVNQFCDLLNTNFHADTANQLLDKLLNDVAPEINTHLKRWNISRKGYDKSVADLRLFISERPAYLLKYLKEKFNLNKEVNISVIVNKEQGRVRLNTLKLKSNYQGVYLQNVPQKVTATPNFEYDFIGWKNRKDTARVLYVELNSDNEVFEPIFRKRQNSSLFGKIVFSEINAQQDSVKNDFIEFYNNSSTDINLSGFLLMDNKSKNRFYFPENTIVKANDFLMLTDSVSLLSVKRNVVGGLSFGFKAGKDEIKLFDEKKQLIHHVQLSKLPKETKGLNLALIDFRSNYGGSNSYTLEKPTPLARSKSYMNLLHKEAEDSFYKKLFFYTGISAALIFILLLFRYFITRKKFKN